MFIQTEILDSLPQDRTDKEPFEIVTALPHGKVLRTYPVFDKGDSSYFNSVPAEWTNIYNLLLNWHIAFFNRLDLEAV